VIIFDMRGYGLSSGARGSTIGGQDYYDGIEWAAAQPWSSGKVGMSGVSVLAGNGVDAAAQNRRL